MDKKIFIGLILISFLLNACQENHTSVDYLENVLEKLQTVKSASYNSGIEAWVPSDTAPAHVYKSFVQEYDNPADTTIGSKQVRLMKDKSIADFIYDGNMRAYIYHKHKGVLIDSFKLKRNLAYRPTTPPFFNYAKSILQYALTTDDSISFSFQDLDTSLYVQITIHEENQVEFFGKAYHVPSSPYVFGDPTSRYEIWIDKSRDLPFKVRREMSHDISVEICSNVEINTLDINNFNPNDYFPKDYKFREAGVNNKRQNKSKLIGKTAANWVLKDVDNRDVSLDALKSKIVVLQFTSVSCGPCRVSIPGLNKLASLYNKNDVDFVAIECTTKSLRALKHYRDKNKINYAFIQSSEQVLKDYAVSSFPIFYFLDENREIVKIIRGYSEGKTDKEINSILNEMIKEHV